MFGTTAITAVTAQNTVGDRCRGHPVDFVDAQITAVLSDLPVAAVKTGMLATAQIVELVAKRAEAGDLPNLVVDPVMVASSGTACSTTMPSSVPPRLFPHALVVTPNLFEAAILAGVEPLRRHRHRHHGRPRRPRSTDSARPGCW